MGEEQPRELKRAGGHGYSREHEISQANSRDFKQHGVKSV